MHSMIGECSCGHLSLDVPPDPLENHWLGVGAIVLLIEIPLYTPDLKAFGLDYYAEKSFKDMGQILMVFSLHNRAFEMLAYSNLRCVRKEMREPGTLILPHNEIRQKC